ncbi:transcriptional regulator [Azotobacter bryophylli]|uniref:Transcriptional regulator n=1 Tax=Azotobacter bryophylli TaxID=1986537 RepID=A0ABV7B0R9_9GAMM
MSRTDIPTDPAIRWEWIKYQLRSCSTSLAQLAREQSVSDAAVKNVKRVPYPRMERAIADALGLEPIDLWPERWNADGTPQRQRPNRTESTAAKAQEHTAAPKPKHARNRVEG